MSNKISYTDRRIKRSKDALKKSIIELMKEKDYKDITIKDIVERADLNRGTFYKHYQLKEELLDEVINDVLTNLIESYRDPYKNVDTFVLKDLSSSAIKIFEHVENHKNFYTLVVKSSALSCFQNKICYELRKLALQDLSEGQPNPALNRELYANYQSYAIFGLIVEWINGGFKYSAHYLAEQLIGILNNSHGDAIFKTNIK